MNKYFDYIILGLSVIALLGLLIIGFWYMNAGPGVDTFQNVNEWIIKKLQNL